MTTLIGLCKNEQEAETAVQSLAASDLDDIEFRTISNWQHDREPEMTVVTALNSGVSPSNMPVAAAMPTSWNLSSEERGFFKRAVQNGGVLLVVEADDEQVAQVKSILQEHSEKVTTGS